MKQLANELYSVDTFRYIQDDTVLVGKGYYLPRNQCPSCGDIGQEVWKEGDRYKIFRCPYCKVQYRMIFERRGSNVHCN